MKQATVRVALSIAGLFILYVAGVLVRGCCGIRVLVRNETGKILPQVSLKVLNDGPRYELGEIRVGGRKHVFVRPKNESHITLEFVDEQGGSHFEVAVGYAESGYCGSARATVLPRGEVKVSENVDVALCKGSWFDFFR